MSDLELTNLVIADRTRRSQERALGRLKNSMRDSTSAFKPRTITKPLDSLGLSPAIIAKLRASGRPDSEIMITLKQKGVI